MATYIARDVRAPHPGDPKDRDTRVELLLDLGFGLTSVAVFKGATGARLFGKLIGALAKGGKDEVIVKDADGSITYLVGGLDQLAGDK